MPRGSAILLIFSLLFPFLLKNGALLQFYNTSLFSRKAKCEQVTLVTCAGKCQLVKVMKEIPSSQHPSSFPWVMDFELSPFELPVKVSEPTTLSYFKSQVFIHLTAQIRKGFAIPSEHPPAFFIV